MLPFWAGAAVPCALDAVMAAHFWVLESRRVAAVLRAMCLLNIREEIHVQIIIIKHTPQD